MARHVGHDRMALQLAETAAEGDVLVVADVLIPEHQHLVRQQRRMDGRDHLAVQRLAQVHARDLGAQHRPQRLDAQAGEVVFPQGGRPGDGVHGRRSPSG